MGSQVTHWAAFAKKYVIPFSERTPAASYRHAAYALAKRADTPGTRGEGGNRRPGMSVTKRDAFSVSQRRYHPTLGRSTRLQKPESSLFNLLDLPEIGQLR
jgi:hypothetical protein